MPLNLNPEVRQSIRTLHERAERGEIPGLFYCIQVGDSRSEWAVAGSFRDLPDMAVANVIKASQELKAYAQFKKIDPLTASIVMCDDVDITSGSALPWLEPYAMRS